MARRTGDRMAQEAERARVRRASYELAKALKALPPFDISDPAQMDERCMAILDACEEHGLIPTLGMVAIGLGTNADALRHVREGQMVGWGLERLTRQSAEVLAKNLMMYEGVFGSNFENGAYSQPVTGIFAAKNNYGWRDAREVHEVSVHVEATAEEIAGRYMGALPQHVCVDGSVREPQESRSARAIGRVADGVSEQVEAGRYPEYEPPEE